MAGAARARARARRRAACEDGSNHVHPQRRRAAGPGPSSPPRRRPELLWRPRRSFGVTIVVVLICKRERGNCSLPPLFSQSVLLSTLCPLAELRSCRTPARPPPPRGAHALAPGGLGSLLSWQFSKSVHHSCRASLIYISPSPEVGRRSGDYYPVGGMLDQNLLSKGFPVDFCRFCSQYAWITGPNTAANCRLPSAPTS